MRHTLWVLLFLGFAACKATDPSDSSLLSEDTTAADEADSGAAADVSEDGGDGSDGGDGVDPNDGGGDDTASSDMGDGEDADGSDTASDGGDIVFPAPEPGDIVITEVVFDTDNTGPEWVEIHNRSDRTLALSMMALGDRASPMGVAVATGEATLAPDERALLVEFLAEGFGSTQLFSYESGLRIGDDDALYLRVNDVVIHSIDLGSATVIDETAGASHMLSQPAESTLDTGNLNNWCPSALGSAGQATPGAANGTCPLDENTPAPAAGEFVITEALVDAVGDDAGLEWFELANTSAGPRRLAGVTLAWDDEDITFSDPTLVIGSGEHLVFAAELAAADMPQSLSIAGLRLPNSGSTVALSLGDMMLMSWAYDQNFPIVEGRALSQDPEHRGTPFGETVDAWCASTASTSILGAYGASPGMQNPACAVDTAADPVAGDLVITEIMPNPEDGPDMGREWIEIQSLAAASVKLNGLQVTSDDGSRTLIEPGLALAPLERTLIRFRDAVKVPTAAEVEMGDLALEHEADTITLAMGGVVIDSVSYSDDDVWPIERGWSLNLHPDATNAGANDDPYHWCFGWARIDNRWDQRGTPGNANEECPFMTTNASISESLEVYDLDEEAPIAVSLSMDPTHLAELEAINDMTTEAPEHPVTITIGDFTTSNATITLRGATSRLVAQKSFKVKLLDTTYREQKTLHFAKNPFDLTRIRNQVAFRLMRSVPHLPSVRTQFVNMTMNGIDYGMFTQLEQLSRRYLKNHRLETRGTLFKASAFSFFASSLNAGEGIVDGLELKSGDNWQAIYDAVSAINDGGQDINTVVAQRFNRNNLITWLATNFLLSNLDTVSQNFYLYIPATDPERIYFVPWDYDGAWDWHLQGVGSPRERYRQGLTNWWGMPLFSRWLQDPSNLADLSARIVDLEANRYDTPTVTALVENMDTYAGPRVLTSPDSDAGNLPVGIRADEVDRLKTVPENRMGNYAAWVERPTPGWTGISYPSPGVMRFSWDPAIDLQGDTWTAEVVLSDGPCLTENTICFEPEHIVGTSTGHVGTSVELTSLAFPGVAAGDYFFLVYYRDSKGNYQIGFNQFFPLTVTVP